MMLHIWRIQGMKKTLALLTVLSAFTASPAFAADVEFNGSVSSSCTIDNIVAGTLTANPGVTELASGASGAGSFDISANATIFTLSVSNPSGWDNEPGTTPTTFAASADLAGNTATPGSSVVVPNGDTTGSVGLTATANSGTFPNGSYTATVTITCS
jgi:hypothetical protein